MKWCVSFFLLYLTLSSCLFAGGEIELCKYGNYCRGIVGSESKITFHERRTGTKGIIDKYPFHGFIQENPEQAAKFVRFALKTMHHLPKIVTVLYCSKEECQNLESSEADCCSHVQALRRFYEQFNAQIISYRVKEDLRYRDEGIKEYPGLYVTINPATLAPDHDDPRVELK